MGSRTWSTMLREGLQEVVNVCGTITARIASALNQSTSASRAVIGGALGALAADACARGVAYERHAQGQCNIN